MGSYDYDESVRLECAYATIGECESDSDERYFYRVRTVRRGEWRGWSIWIGDDGTIFENPPCSNSLADVGQVEFVPLPDSDASYSTWRRWAAKVIDRILDSQEFCLYHLLEDCYEWKSRKEKQQRARELCRQIPIEWIHPCAAN